ncbi:MAG TPA: dihydropteroate synthase [Longilinea sp.]|nr:dihydropteroate synthase [Longilinea sp.]
MTTSALLPFGTRTFIMGIINLTPDSFSGDGLLTKSNWVEAAVRQAQRFIEEGADILDIGGESTRPGAGIVSKEEELQRVIPVVEAIHAALPDALISVDTSKAVVAEGGLKAGAAWVNDVWGLRADPDLAAVIAQFQAPVVLMHNRSKPGSPELDARLGGRYIGSSYTNLIEEVKAELTESITLALQAGIPSGGIIIDPGIGFGKTVEQNLELVRRLGEFKALGYPILLGVSRKSFIGYTLDLPPAERLEGTLAASVVGITQGADIIRVHDVGAMVRAARMADAILRFSPQI